MSDRVINVNGRLLNFDQPYMDDHIFPSTCNIDIPDKVPVLFNFNREDPIGNAEIYRDDTGLMCNGTIKVCGELEEILGEDSGFGFGGYYNKVKSHTENGIRVIDDCRIASCSITPAPIDPDCVLHTSDIQKGEQHGK